MILIGKASKKELRRMVMSDLKYSEYENMYPETVIIRKEGYFYMVRGRGAIVCHHFFKYKCWKSENDVVSTGFSENGLKMVCTKLHEESISYLVLVKGEIVEGENFNENNRFHEFDNMDLSDIPYRESNKKTKETADRTTEGFLSEEERKLCDISIKYLERLLDGRNPVNNSVIENDTVMSDANVQRCFSFIIDILKRAHDKQEIVTKPKAMGKKTVNRIALKPDSDSVIDKMIQDRDVKMTEMESLIKPFMNELFEGDVEKITTYKISNWLLDNGYLVSVKDDRGSNHREASEEGKIIGIINAIVKRDDNSSYIQYKFSPKAQRFVFENLADIAVYKKSKKK